MTARLVFALLLGAALIALPVHLDRTARMLLGVLP